MRRQSRGLLSALLGLCVTGSVLTGSVPAGTPAQARVISTTTTETASETTAVTKAGTAGTAGTSTVTTVLAVSVDGLKPWAIRTLGPERAPVLHRLIREGASTLNARTARELTDTLPNHTTMVTSRRISAASGGHGVTWNDDRLEPRTVHEAAGGRVGSMFSQVAASGGETALFAGKSKFRLFARSWPGGIDRFELREHNGRLVGLALADLREHERALRFVHLSAPDVVGHRSGFRSAAYLDAVARVDTLLGRLLATLEEPGLAGRSALVVTADHGGAAGSHRDPTKLANYRIPFLAWGVGVAPGADLYTLNPDYADPGRRRTGYATAPPPVRNGALANLVADLLGLGPVPGSEHNAAQDLDLR